LIRSPHLRWRIDVFCEKIFDRIASVRLHIEECVMVSLKYRGLTPDDLIFALLRGSFLELARQFALRDPTSAEQAITSIETFFERQFLQLGRELASPAELGEVATFLKAMTHEARDDIETAGQPKPE
jgi:hypothetical protein